ncbi:hypothetical protein GCM10012275_54940 [Longimycelium tulufanense]|uniref:Uncharacterized protein n=1 Tax=Longimycelium tulufanense TaxID=907463 RepID=A0A8J3CDB2_9PSEU|nr:hypothetical protein GCM10012275_54940 [Longimycelium tulufanense]
MTDLENTYFSAYHCLYYCLGCPNCRDMGEDELYAELLRAEGTDG